MTTITIHLDQQTEARLRAISAELGRHVEELACSAVAEAALDYFRPKHRTVRDPASLTIDMEARN